MDWLDRCRAHGPRRPAVRERISRAGRVRGKWSRSGSPRRRPRGVGALLRLDRRSSIARRQGFDGRQRLGSDAGGHGDEGEAGSRCKHARRLVAAFRAGRRRVVTSRSLLPRRDPHRCGVARAHRHRDGCGGAGCRRGPRHEAFRNAGTQQQRRQDQPAGQPASRAQSLQGTRHTPSVLNVARRDTHDTARRPMSQSVSERPRDRRHCALPASCLLPSTATNSHA